MVFLQTAVVVGVKKHVSWKIVCYMKEITILIENEWLSEGFWQLYTSHRNVCVYIIPPGG